MHKHTRVIALLLLGGLARSASAQSPAAPAQMSACTYQACALRLEPTFLGVALVKGAAGERVSKISLFGGGVDALLAGPDSSASLARTYVSSARRAGTLGLIGVVAYTIASARTNSFRRNGDAADVALLVGSVGFVAASLPYGIRAQRSLSRAIWWYNAALPR